MLWTNKISTIAYVLERLSVRDADGNEVAQDFGFSQLTEIALKAVRSGNTIFFIGNGASASMASHFAADLSKNGKVHTEVFTDLSLITAIANDISYDEVFAYPLRTKMVKGDMLIAISTSGNSPNVLRGAETVRDLEGIVITLSAMKAENALRKLGNINFYVPADTYGLAETAHAAVMHFWIDNILSELNDQ